MGVPEPQIGHVVGEKYRLEQLLGRGGMGVVYRARHRITDRVVALKWLLEDDEQRRARFLREARAMGRLSHPNVVGILDVGDHEGAIFLVMDYLEGKSLRELIEAGRQPPARAIELVMPALSGVAAAHQAGILHRDLKPENLFVLCDEDGTPYDTKVLDFGVAKPFGQDHTVASLTHSGAIVGTPRYMAPEQLGEETTLDPRCDVYALGLIVYELLTGQLPYRARALNALLIEILTGEVRSPRELVPELPEALAEIVMKALARDREARFADVASFARALEPWGGGVRFEAPRRVHTPSSGETEPGPVAGIRPARTPAPEERSTRSDRPARVGDRAETPESLAPTVASGDARAVTGSAPSIDLPRSRALPIAGAIAALLALGAVLALAMASSESEPVTPPAHPAPRAAAPVEAPASRPEPREEEPEPRPIAPREEATPVLAEPEPPTAAPPPTRRRSPPRSPQPAAPAPSATAPSSEAPPVRVDTRAGTLRQDDF